LDRELPNRCIGKRANHSLGPSFSRIDLDALFFVQICRSIVYPEKVKNVNELRDRIRATESVTNETFAQYLAIDSISS
jgi:hypothetical protein